MPSPLRIQRNEERKLLMRDQLLAAAARVFIQNGYHKTLISDIVAEAGVGQGTFYRNFCDKRSIFETLLENFVEELLNEFSEMQINPANKFEDYRTLSNEAILRMARKLDQNRDLCLVFLREIPSIDKEFSEKLENIFDRFVMVAQFHLDHAIANGFARPCHSNIAAHAMIGTALRLFQQWGNGRIKNTKLENVILEASDFAFWGVALTPKGMNS